MLVLMLSILFELMGYAIKRYAARLVVLLYLDSRKQCKLDA